MVAPEVSVLLKVEELPDTERGSELRFSLNAPPELADSAARESEAMGPGPSSLGLRYRSGSEVTCRLWSAQGA